MLLNDYFKTRATLLMKNLLDTKQLLSVIPFDLNVQDKKNAFDKLIILKKCKKCWYLCWKVQ